MKTKYIVILVLLIGYFSFAQNTVIPDPAFEQALIDLNLDSGTVNGVVPTVNISGVTSLNVEFKNINSLVGIEDFVALVDLNIYSNTISNINLSTLTYLKTLDCGANGLTALDISNNVNLELVYCDENDFTTLDVSTNIKLRKFFTSLTPITSLDFSNCPDLYYLQCRNSLALTRLNVKNGNNNTITTFDITSNPNLSCVKVDNVAWSTSTWTSKDAQTSYHEDCFETYIPDTNFETYLETHNSTGGLVILGSPFSMGNGIANDHYVTTANINTVLFISVANKNITDLTGIQNFVMLENLSVHSNQLTDLDLSGNLNLTQLYCSTNSLTTLDLTANTLLQWIECDNNNLTSLSLGSKPSLITLMCYNNTIASLNLSQLPALANLNCNNNSLTSLSTANNVVLKKMSFGNNIIANIDITNNLILEELNASHNALTNLTFGNNTNLELVYVGWNNLTDLDLSACVSLVDITCHNNQLTGLNLKNGNNTNMFIFEATLNPSLQCINVDNVAYANTNWVSIDPQTYFSDHCFLTYVPDTNFEQSLIDLGYDTILDDYVLTANIDNVISLDVFNKGISDMTGIEAFSALKTLNCASNSYSALDLSSNVLLEGLQCGDNGLLLNLNVTQNTVLTLLNTRQSNIANLDITTLPSLTYLNAEDMGLTSLNVSQNSFLQELYCGNNSITTLDLSANSAIEKLIANNNELMVLNVSTLVNLLELDISNNVLTELNVKNGVNTFATNFDARNNPNLICIQVDNPIWSTTNWTQIDAQSNFNINCYTYVPDTNFEQALIDLGYDNILDDYVLTSNINSITSLNIENKNISDLTGIEAFTLLEYFDCSDNQITVLNLSTLNTLLELDVSSNLLTVLNIKNGANTSIANTTSFDARNNFNLTCIQVDNAIWSTTNWAQIDEQAGFNEQCYTYVPDDNFEQALIDLGYDTVLDDYVFTANINTVTTITVENKNISDLTGIEDFVLLQYLKCGNNQLTSLDVSQNLGLILLWCSNNLISNLDVTHNSWLSSLRTRYLNLTSLNVTQNSKLAYFSCDYNQITHLDVTQNPLLKGLACNDNAILNLDISQNQSLSYISCQNNQIKNFTVDYHPQISSVLCFNNNIKSVDVSQCPLLKTLMVQLNDLEQLYIKNGHNTDMLTFIVYSNPNLYCIEVDDPVYCAANWSSASQSTFSENCSIKVAPKVFLQGAASNPVVGEELLMRDDLRLANYMPLSAPFTDAATCEASVLTVTGNNAIVDWLWVELRDATDDTITISGQSALLQRDGDVVGLDGVSPLGFRNLPNNYHVMIKHQSHLGIVSSTSLQLDHLVSSLDLMSVASTVKGGSNAVSVLPNGLYAMYCGDFDNNGQIQNTDISSVRLLIGGSGYSKADMDMNGQIQNTDINNIMNPNIGKGEQF